MGRVAPRGAPLDLAFVWRAALGDTPGSRRALPRHRSRQACAPAAAGAAGRGTAPPARRRTAAGRAAPAPAAWPLAGLSARFPDWRFSLGIEPVLLTQLREWPTATPAPTAPGRRPRWAPATRRRRTPRRSWPAWPGWPASDSGGDRGRPLCRRRPGPSRHSGVARRLRAGPAGQAGGRRRRMQPGASSLPGPSSPGLDLSSGSLGDYGAGVDRPRAGRRRGGRRPQRAGGQGHGGGAGCTTTRTIG